MVKNKCLKHKVTYFRQLMTTPHVRKALPLCVVLLPLNLLLLLSSSDACAACLCAVMIQAASSSLKKFFANNAKCQSPVPAEFPPVLYSSIIKNTSCNCSGSVDNFHPMMFHFSPGRISILCCSNTHLHFVCSQLNTSGTVPFWLDL